MPHYILVRNKDNYVKDHSMDTIDPDEAKRFDTENDAEVFAVDNHLYEHQTVKVDW